MKWTLLITLMVLAISVSASAQDPAKVDPKHYKVVYEDASVRLLRITLGPKEKTVMHEHPGGCAINITDVHAKTTLPDGKVSTSDGKAGEGSCSTTTTRHQQENTSDKPIEVYQLELKPTKKP